MKRYQVFISSTYNDLKEERSAVLKSVLKLRHIPVGMEHFVASNEEQFNYIKKLLEDTDYYIVIVGNRYGSVADDGMSYTEKEFDYAVSLGIPIIACVHSNPDAFPINKSDTDKKSIEKLRKFREKIMQRRLISYIDWTTPETLTSEVVVALVNMINDYPRQGWERAGAYGNSDLLSQINELRLENDKLKAKIRDYETYSEYERTIISKFPWEKTLEVKGYPSGAYITVDYYKNSFIDVKLSWKQVFGVLGRILLIDDNFEGAKFDLDRELFLDSNLYFKLLESDFRMIVAELSMFGIVNVSNDRIYLEKEGKRVLCTNGLDIREILEPIHRQVQNVIVRGEVLEIKEYIKLLEQVQIGSLLKDEDTMPSLKSLPHFLERSIIIKNRKNGKFEKAFQIAQKFKDIRSIMNLNYLRTQILWLAEYLTDLIKEVPH